MIDSLTIYPWPGNIRALENVIERAIILSREPHLELSEAFPDKPVGAQKSQPGTLHEIESHPIAAVLKVTNGRASGANGAAKILGMKPTTLESRTKKLGVEKFT